MIAKTQQTLRQLYNDLLAAKQLGSRQTESHWNYIASINRLSDFLGRPATVADLPTIGDAFFAWLVSERHYRAPTIRSVKVRLRSIWRHAYRKRLIGTLPPPLPSKESSAPPRAPVAVDPAAETLWRLLDQYLLQNDLRPASESWYRRAVRVFTNWHGCDPPIETVSEDLLSRFLRDKQAAGCSTYYLRGLRSALLAVLGLKVDPRRVRRIKLAPLDYRAWTAVEVSAILHAARKIFPPPKADYYELVVQLGYHTGLNLCDLDLLTRANVGKDGTIICRRSKTNKLVTVWAPPEILKRLPADGKLLPRLWSDEQFRKDFHKLVNAAGLVGSFKNIRKASGTEADVQTGRGHEHLANGRAIFEKHYLDHQRVHREPVKLKRLPGTAKGGAA